MSLQKTYGVSGLIEWNTTITSGKAKMRVVFSGGALTAYGTTPATFTTRSLLVQSVIENSDYFKNGRIQLLNVIETPTSTAAPAENVVAGIEPTPAPATDAQAMPLANVDVTCLDDAKEYLHEHFGLRRIRTWAEANKAGEEHGVAFVLKQ